MLSSQGLDERNTQQVHVGSSWIARMLPSLSAPALATTLSLQHPISSGVAATADPLRDSPCEARYYCFSSTEMVQPSKFAAVTSM